MVEREGMIDREERESNAVGRPAARMYRRLS
jgi:hypothetical protein